MQCINLIDTPKRSVFLYPLFPEATFLSLPSSRLFCTADNLTGRRLMMGGACKKKLVRCGPGDVLVNFLVPEFGGENALEGLALG